MRTKLSVCLRKTHFASEGEARRASARTDYLLRPYRCERCRQFHLTSRTKGKRIQRPEPS
jgi:hypothetical protein